MPQPSGPSSSSGASSRTLTVLASCAMAKVAKEDCAKNRSRSVASPLASDRACEPSGRWPAKLMSLKLAQLAGDPSRQGRHCPQWRKLNATWSPGPTFRTALPTASTIPAPSWPSTIGSGAGYTWSRTTRSVWHSPVATMRTRTSSARGGSKRAAPSSKEPFSRTMAAVISRVPVGSSAIVAPQRYSNIAQVTISAFGRVASSKP